MSNKFNFCRYHFKDRLSHIKNKMPCIIQKSSMRITRFQLFFQLTYPFGIAYFTDIALILPYRNIIRNKIVIGTIRCYDSYGLIRTKTKTSSPLVNIIKFYDNCIIFIVYYGFCKWNCMYNNRRLKNFCHDLHLILLAIRLSV